MTDCLSCRHAKPWRTPDGRLDFSVRVCQRFPPVPVVVPAAPGTVSIQNRFPLIGKDVWCAEHDPRLPGEARPETPGKPQ